MIGLEDHTHLPATQDILATMDTVDSNKVIQSKVYSKTKTKPKVYRKNKQNIDIETNTDNNKNRKYNKEQKAVDTSSDRISSVHTRPKQVCVWTAEWILKRLKEEKRDEVTSL